jgi:hypothetical protein
MSLGLLGGCCGPCFGPVAGFLARSIAATVPWYGSFAFAGGLSTTLWLVETQTTGFVNLVSTYGAGWVSASQTIVTTINQWDGSSSTVTTYFPDEAAYLARQAVEFGPGLLEAVTVTSDDTIQSYDYVLPSNPSEIHYTQSTVFTVPVTQADCLANAHALIDSYVSAGAAAFAGLPFSNGSDGLNAYLALAYNAAGAKTATAETFGYTNPPDTVLASLPIATYEVLGAGAAVGDAVTLQIGQVFTDYNTWVTTTDAATFGITAACYEWIGNAVPPTAADVVYTYGLPSSGTWTSIIADVGNNLGSPYDGSPNPGATTC